MIAIIFIEIIESWGHHMKSLIKKLFVILGASTFVLVGCKRRNNAPVEEPPVEEQQNGDSSIEKIDNEPCSSYSQETLIFT